MRFTATDKWNLYARALVKTISHRIYFRKGSSLSDALSSGTWVEATKYISAFSAPNSSIELGVGQTATDAINLTGNNIAWWKANVFNASASQYIEIKVVFALALGSDACTDTCYTFSGFVDKAARYSELTDTVSFNAFTAQDILGYLAAEVISVQYVETSIDGGGTDGLVIPNVPLLYVKNANITSYALKVGTHTIGYRFTEDTPDVYEANLDGGDWVTLANGDNTLGNAVAPATDTERIVLYVADTTKLPQAGDEITDTILVVTEGDTLPRQWFRYISVRRLLERMFTQCGITSVTFDTLEMDVAVGGSKVSFLDAPPNDDTIWDAKCAMVSDGTDLWLSVRNRLYKRTMSTGVYTLKATLTAGYLITRLWYDSNGYIWVYAQQSLTNTAGYLLRHTISGATNSAEIALANSTKYAIELDPGWGIVYTNISTRAVRGVDSATLTEQLIFTLATLGYTGSDGPSGGFMFYRSSKIYLHTTVVGVDSYYHRIYYAAGWNDDGQVLTLTAPYNVGAFDSSEDRIYFYDSVNFKFKSHLYNNATETDILTIGQELVDAMVYTGGKTYVTTPKYGYLYELDGNAATKLNTLGPRLYTKYFCFASLDSRVYGIDEAGRLYHYASALAMYVPLADFSGKTVLEAFSDILQGFGLVANVSSHKLGYVYRRGNASGTPQTTGNTLSVTTEEASSIDEDVLSYAGCGFVSVDNGTVRYTYDGAAYNSEVLSDVRSVRINNPYVPDEIVQDVCKHNYEYFKTDRTLYTVRLGCVPLFQYEPFDNCSITFTTTKIVKTGSGPIYGVGYGLDGSMTVRVLI